jgi:DNA-binding beta-propeller fold protein YncE
VAYDASDGSLRWTAVDPSTTFGYGEGVTVSPDGSKVLVTGPLLVGSVTQMRTWSYSTDDGAPLWADTFAGPAGGTQPSGIALSPDGARAFVAGTTLTSTKRAVVVAYDVVSGDQDWSTTTLGAAARGASTSAVATTPDGAQVIVAGSSNTSGGTDGLVAAFDSETGGESWLRTYSVSGFVQTNGAVLGLTTDGTRAYVSGGACVTAQCDVQAWLTVAYSIPDGTFQWGQRFQPSGSDDHPFGIAVTPDGSQVVVAGDSHNIASEAEGFAAVGYAG